MATANEGAAARRTAEIRASLQFFARALQLASMGYTPEPPDQARTAVRIALAGVIKLISDLFPDEPSFPAPLIQLRLDLDDLERGKVSKLFKAKKVAHRPPTALSEELFRAMAAAAVTRLMEGAKLTHEKAGRDVARRLEKMGAKSSGKAVTYKQVADWREKMMTELASENLGVARYELADYSVGTVWGRKGDLYYLIDLIRVRLDYPALRRKVIEVYQRWRWQDPTILIEDAGSGTSLHQDLYEKNIPAMAIKPEGDKVMRMSAQTAKIEAGAVHLPRGAPWLDDLRSEVLAFPQGLHDDQVDSISQALNWMSARPKSRALFTSV
jgi:predicted phage terminase large subunit-like protein